jgi:hypothetical protein
MSGSWSVGPCAFAVDPEFDTHALLVEWLDAQNTGNFELPTALFARPASSARAALCAALRVPVPDEPFPVTPLGLDHRRVDAVQAGPRRCSTLKRTVMKPKP